MRKFDKPWTEEELAILREKWAEGLTCEKIGTLLKRTKSAISGAAARYGLPRRLTNAGNPIAHVWTPTREQEIRILYDEGLDCAHIAVRMGVDFSPSSVRHALKRLNLTPHPAKQRRKVRPPRVSKHKGTPANWDKWCAEDTPENHSKNLTMMELTPTSCRWPMSGVGADMLSCGAERMANSPYCEHHTVRAIQEDE